MKQKVIQFLKDYTWMFIASGIMLGLSIYWQDTWLGICSSLSGIICVILTAQGKKRCYIYGIVNSVLYGIIAYQAKYYGDFMLNIFYFTPIQVWGWFAWRKKENKDTGIVESKRMTKKQFLIFAAVTVFGTSLYGLILWLINGRLPFVDATTTVLSVIAFYISIKCYSEQWLLWIIVDVISVGMWIYYLIITGGEAVATLIMWVVFLLNAIFGYVMWLKRSRKSIKIKAEEAVNKEALNV